MSRHLTWRSIMQHHWTWNLWETHCRWALPFLMMVFGDLQAGHFQKRCRRWREGCSKHAACSTVAGLNMEWVEKNWSCFIILSLHESTKVCSISGQAFGSWVWYWYVDVRFCFTVFGGVRHILIASPAPCTGTVIGSGSRCQATKCVRCAGAFDNPSSRRAALSNCSAASWRTSERPSSALRGSTSSTSTFINLSVPFVKLYTYRHIILYQLAKGDWGILGSMPMCIRGLAHRGRGTRYGNVEAFVACGCTKWRCWGQGRRDDKKTVWTNEEAKP